MRFENGAKNFIKIRIKNQFQIELNGNKKRNVKICGKLEQR